MILLIDAGNTRIKWGVRAQDQWRAQGAVLHAATGDLTQIAAAHPGLRRVLGANVAGAAAAEAIAAALHGYAPPPEWLVSSAQCCGVHNRYHQPTQLGADRWAALIGARSLHPSAAALVVTAGTATTVDILDASGSFQGGLILPGEELMRRSLAGNTAQLPFAQGCYVDAPRSTDDAIVSGCLNAQAGAIERMFRQIANDPGALCLLNGGAAGRIAPLLTIPVKHIDNLVLEGLAVIASDAMHP
ncbi:MAG: type III pantothenate kinase [Rhodocyclales bacterium]|nr:type III pantothenate kinase [Rhodocyclales bacterium]